MLLEVYLLDERSANMFKALDAFANWSSKLGQLIDLAVVVIVWNVSHQSCMQMEEESRERTPSSCQPVRDSIQLTLKTSPFEEKYLLSQNFALFLICISAC